MQILQDNKRCKSHTWNDLLLWSASNWRFAEGHRMRQIYGSKAVCAT